MFFCFQNRLKIKLSYIWNLDRMCECYSQLKSGKTVNRGKLQIMRKNRVCET